MTNILILVVELHQTAGTGLTPESPSKASPGPGDTESPSLSPCTNSRVYFYFGTQSANKSSNQYQQQKA